MPGPAPDPNSRRRNAPTIPTTNLPAGGRPGRAPKPPAWVELGAAGKAWWAWAWKTPQAAAWSSGHEVFIARRASLEDDLAVISDVEPLNLLDALQEETQAAVKQLLGRLSALAVGKLQIAKEMRELDDRLGLNPKAMAALRWKIVEDEVAAARASKAEPKAPRSRRLKSVDTAAS